MNQRWNPYHPQLIFILTSALGISPSWVAAKSDWDCREIDGEWICVSKPQKPVIGDKPEKPNQTKKNSASPATTVPKFPAKLPILAKQPGWHCQPDIHNQGWDCNQTGEATSPTGTIENTSVLSAVLTSEDETVFRNLVNSLDHDPWEYCGGTYSALPPFDKSLRDTSSIEVDTDSVEAYENEIATFFGNVDLHRADQRIIAHHLTYDSIADTANAQGQISYFQHGTVLAADSAFIHLDSNKGRLSNTRFISHDRVPAGRGRSRVTYLDGKFMTRHIDVVYTSCPPGNQDWELEAEYLKLNKKSGSGSAKNAWLNFKGVPILYTPALWFPIDDRRTSGILTPSFGFSKENGVDISIPYYWNIAPNYDAIFAPRILSERGMLLGGEFRYLTERSAGQINLEVLPYDAKAEKLRAAGSFRNATKFTNNITADMDLNFVSDKRYIDELVNTLSFSDTRHIRSEANLRYNTAGISMLARLENYQTIDRRINDTDKPYRRLPQLLLNMDERITENYGRFSFDSEFVYFEREHTLTGKRLDLKPKISIPIETAATFFTPSFTLQHTQYWLDNQESGNDATIERTLPIASLDSGVFFERNTKLGDSAFLQTLEPRLFYLYIPKEGQDRIPLFDTSEYDFNFFQLFRENRFSGADRIGDANQLSVAMTSRLLESETGRERISASLGTIIYFEDQDVGLTPETKPAPTQTSNLIGELNVTLTNEWSLRSGLEWNPHQSNTQKGHASLHYWGKDNSLFNIGYRYRRSESTINGNRIDQTDIDRNKIDQADVSLRWPLFRDWHFVGRWQYSFFQNLTLESFAGFEKESCCWRFRILGRHYVNDINSKANTEIFVQLELKGFTSFGHKVDEFLMLSLPGYEPPEL